MGWVCYGMVVRDAGWFSCSIYKSRSGGAGGERYCTLFFVQVRQVLAIDGWFVLGARLSVGSFGVASLGIQSWAWCYGFLGDSSCVVSVSHLVGGGVSILDGSYQFSGGFGC